MTQPSLSDCLNIEWKDRLDIEQDGIEKLIIYLVVFYQSGVCRFLKFILPRGIILKTARYPEQTDE